MKNKKNKTYRFKVISVNYTDECNMNCPFCYEKAKYKYKDYKNEEKSRDFWIKLIPYLKNLTPQIALGGGEPFVDVEFVKRMSKECRKNKLLLNITTNGKLLMNMSNEELRSALKGITMVSISVDNYKVRNNDRDLLNIVLLARRIKRVSDTKVGCNMLIQDMQSWDMLKRIIGEFDRVFALCPKNMQSSVLNFKGQYMFYSAKYDYFFVDDLTKKIIEEGRYTNWQSPCHYGKDILSINSRGFVCGCSFDGCDKAVLKLNKPRDAKDISRIIFNNERHNCPYLITDN